MGLSCTWTLNAGEKGDEKDDNRNSLISKIVRVQRGTNVLFD